MHGLSQSRTETFLESYIKLTTGAKILVHICKVIAQSKRLVDCRKVETPSYPLVVDEDDSGPLYLMQKGKHLNRTIIMVQSY